MSRSLNYKRRTELQAAIKIYNIYISIAVCVCVHTNHELWHRITCSRRHLVCFLSLSRDISSSGSGRNPALVIKKQTQEDGEEEAAAEEGG